MTLIRFSRLVFSGAVIAGLIGLGGAGANARQTHKAKISTAQAEAAALKKYKGGKLQGKTELENEAKKWEYAVMVSANGKLHEIMVNADTGKIDSEETVTAKEEAAEKRAETAAKKHVKTKKPSKGVKLEKKK